MDDELITVVCKAVGFFAQSWILVHFLMIKIYGEYIICEPNSFALMVEILFFTIMLWLYTKYVIMKPADRRRR